MKRSSLASLAFVLFLAHSATAAITFSIGEHIDRADVLVLADSSFGVTSNAFVDLVVVPEPGTALLTGLGLAGLASAGRRS
jgi:hypothetical protein